MLKILAPTDFSANSRAGLRFAIQWSTQQKLELVFIHIFHPVMLPVWGDEDFKKYTESETARYLNKLQRLVSGLYRSMDIKPGKYSCIIKQGISPDISIMDYCRSRNDIDYLCIATHGAGRLKKLFGTNTGNLITQSRVPVIAVPKNYRRRSVNHLLYATDLNNYAGELKKVMEFARPLKARIEVLHLTWPNEVLPDKQTLKKAAGSNFSYGIEFRMVKTSLVDSFLKELKKRIYGSKPSLVILFTDQHRSFFQKIMFPSSAERLSFETTVPLLAFQKDNFKTNSK